MPPCEKIQFVAVWSIISGPCLNRKIQARYFHGFGDSLAGCHSVGRPPLDRTSLLYKLHPERKTSRHGTRENLVQSYRIDLRNRVQGFCRKRNIDDLPKTWCGPTSVCRAGRTTLYLISPNKIFSLQPCQFLQKELDTDILFVLKISLFPNVSVFSTAFSKKIRLFDHHLIFSHQRRKIGICDCNLYTGYKITANLTIIPSSFVVFLTFPPNKIYCIRLDLQPHVM